MKVWAHSNKSKCEKEKLYSFTKEYEWKKVTDILNNYQNKQTEKN